MIPLASYTQEAFRWRKDDGSESAATWHLAENAGKIEDGGFILSPSLLDVNVRLRILTSNTTFAATLNPRLQYSKNGGVFTDVNATSSVVRSSASTHFVDDAATTQQLTTAGYGFVAGAMDENNGAFSTGVYLAEQETEHEWCFQFRSVDIARGDTIDFQAVDSALGEYVKYNYYPRAKYGSNSGNFFEVF